MLHIDYMGGISIWEVKRKMRVARALYANFLPDCTTFGQLIQLIIGLLLQVLLVKAACSSNCAVEK